MWRKLFKKKASQDIRDTEVRAESYAPGTGISYDPQLIERFEGHHALLLKTYERIHTTANEDRNYSEIQTTMGRFRRVLKEHLLEENIHLYIYLNKCLAHDSSSSQLVLAMKNEMSRIGRKVIAFLNHYENTGVDESNIDVFVSQLEEMGAALTDRIEREERSLYTLYLPPDSY
ncbi:MAG: hemerythrin domain-containing protein [Marinobacter sp.]